MTKFLIAIILLATGIKYISGCSAFDYNSYGFAELSLQDEESEQQKGEQEKSKNDNEEKVFLHSIVCSFLNTSAKFSKILWQQDAYLGFVNSPNTPPPDTV